MRNWFTTSRLDYPESAEFAEARSKYILPMAKCALCGDGRGFPEIEYPDVAAEKVFDRSTLSTLVEQRWPKADWSTFVALRDCLAPHLPKGSFLAPACGFGVMCAKIFKKFDGFGYAGMARVIATDAALDRIRNAGFRLRTTSIDVRQSGSAKGIRASYIHLKLAGDIPPSSGIAICPECRRPSRPQDKDGDKILVEKSAPIDEPVFRLSYSPTTIIYRADFVEFLTKGLGISNLTFMPIPTS